MPTVSNKTMKRVALKHNTSLNMFKSMMRDFQKENPKILFEKGLDADLKESVEALSKWYSTERKTQQTAETRFPGDSELWN